MAFYIGLDIGGTKMSGIVFDGKDVSRELAMATPKSLPAFKKALIRLLEFLSAGKHIASVGVGIAGIISPKTGQILYSPNLKFLVRFSPEKFLKANGYRSVRAENDANCFALAESRFGKGSHFRNFVGLTLGTGLGGGIILNKKIYTGSNGSAGEAGHMMADFRYDAERYFQKARDKKDFKKMGEVLGILFANVANLLDIEAVVLGGTVAFRHSSQFLPSALATAKKHYVNKSSPPKIFISSLKNPGSLGAALLAME